MVTNEEVEREIREVQKDLSAFSSAYHIMQERLHELEGEDPARFQKFHNWAGTQAVVCTLVMCIVRCENLIEEYNKELAKRAAIN